MTTEPVDVKLQRLHQASERVGASLLELELDPNRELLEKSRLEGESAVRWAATSATLTQLWQWHGMLQAHLERADGVRDRRGGLDADQLAELSDLLSGPSIELSGEVVPLQQRELLGSSAATRTCSPDDLLERMSAAFDEVKTFLGAVAQAWDGLLPRLAAAQSALSKTADVSHGIGDAAADELELSRAELARISQALAKDPVSVAPAAVDAAEASLAATQREIEALGELSREIARRLQEAAALLQALNGAQAECETAHRHATARIAGGALPEPPGLAPDLESALQRVEQLSQASAWRDARAALADWTDRVTAALERTRQITAENRAPIEARNELRGLLDAYEAKAKRLGLIEDDALSALYGQAHDALYTAPTDVERAADLVRRYQRALPGTPPRREVLT